MTPVGGVVLAAGRGERLGGVCKAALRLPDGRSFLAAVVDAARAAGVAPIVVVAAAPFSAEVRALAAAAGVAVVENPTPELGMASSFAVGLDALPGAGLARVLAWPVDHPAVRAATVGAIVSAGAAGRIVVPVHGGRGGHPTCFAAALLGECRAAARADGGLRAVVRADPGRVTRLTVDDPGVVADVDSPMDYAMIKG